MNLLCDCPGRISDWGVPFHEIELNTQPDWIRSLGCQSGLYAGVVPEAWHPLISHMIVEARAEASQFDALASYAQKPDGIPDGAVMLALEGSGFHGQRGRPWRAHAGNIHLSACFHPNRDASELGMGLTMVPAVAVLRTLRKFHRDVPETGIKWVNDILVRGKKVSGVISSTIFQAGRVQTVVFGIGLNVETVPDIEASSLMQRASCLNHCWETKLTWQDVVPVLISSLAAVYQCLMEDGLDAVYGEYVANSIVMGRPVKIYEDRLSDARLLAEGVITGLNRDLSLQLEGREEPIVHGRLVI